MEISKTGTIGVTVVSTPFVVLGRAQASALGVPKLPLVVVEHPFGTRSQQEMPSIAQKCADQLVDLIAGKQAGGT